MSFENSPKLNEPRRQKPSSLTDWLAKNRRKIYTALFFFMIVWLMVVLFASFTRPVSTADRQGGLDGTVLSKDLNPVPAEILINGKVIKNYEDGYFFIPDLPPGEYVMKVDSANGTLERSVVIVTGQVNELGRLIID